jgi:hypothetical protein
LRGPRNALTHICATTLRSCSSSEKNIALWANNFSRLLLCNFSKKIVVSVLLIVIRFSSNHYPLITNHHNW